MPEDRIALESPSLYDDLRVIGVEVAVRRANGRPGGEEELEMFECRHTIPDVSERGSLWSNDKAPICFRVTLHTNRGDLTAYISSSGQVNQGIVF